jgi:hypothetical protein
MSALREPGRPQKEPRLSPAVLSDISPASFSRVADFNGLLNFSSCVSAPEFRSYFGEHGASVF